MKTLGPYTKSQLAEAMLYIEGRPFRLDDYPFFRKVYDLGNVPDLLMKTARQVGKSTFSAGGIVVNSASKPFFKTLYVAPSQKQTFQFSNLRLAKILRNSPYIKQHYISGDKTQNVLSMELANESEINLSYALDDADRIRGISSDMNFLDEVQDIELEAVGPVVRECMSASKYRFTVYTGTPKSMENAIESLWQRSTQAEWVIKCPGCGRHQAIVGYRSIGKKGPVCVKCDHALPVREGFWYEFQPGKRIRGFHVPRPIVPTESENARFWEDIIDKMENYDTPRFNNEVLGISDAKGGRMVSLEELESLCQDYAIQVPPQSEIMDGVRVVCGGVDWTGAGSDYVSRTVAWVFGWTDDFKLKTLYYEILRGANPMEDVRRVADIFDSCRCQLVVGDAGMGAHANAALAEMLGEHRVWQAQYGSYKTHTFRWNGKDRYLIDRTAAIDSIMIKYKYGQVIYPRLSIMGEPIQEVLNEYEEATEEGTKSGGVRVWRHAPAAPDDCLHAQVFADLAIQIAIGRITPYQVPSDAPID